MTEKTIQPDWVKNTAITLQGIEEEAKKPKAVTLNRPDWAKEIELSSLKLYTEKYTSELNLYKESAEQGYLVVDTVVILPFTESAGLYLSKFFTALKEEGKILANKCPKCQRIIFPPRIVCGFCKVRIEDKDENWIELSDKGTVVSYTVVTEREVDRATGEIIGEPYPCSFIRLDGGDEWTLLAHFLEEPDLDKLRTGMRVQAGWRPKGERRGRMSDIMYFRTIENKEQGEKK